MSTRPVLTWDERQTLFADGGLYNFLYITLYFALCFYAVRLARLFVRLTELQGTVDMQRAVELSTLDGLFSDAFMAQPLIQTALRSHDKEPPVPLRSVVLPVHIPRDSIVFDIPNGALEFDIVSNLFQKGESPASPPMFRIVQGYPWKKFVTNWRAAHKKLRTSFTTNGAVYPRPVEEFQQSLEALKSEKEGLRRRKTRSEQNGDRMETSSVEQTERGAGLYAKVRNFVGFRLPKSAKGRSTASPQTNRDVEMGNLRYGQLDEDDDEQHGQSRHGGSSPRASAEGSRSSAGTGLRHSTDKTVGPLRGPAAAGSSSSASASVPTVFDVLSTTLFEDNSDSVSPAAREWVRLPRGAYHCQLPVHPTPTAAPSPASTPSAGSPSSAAVSALLCLYDSASDIAHLVMIRNSFISQFCCDASGFYGLKDVYGKPDPEIVEGQPAAAHDGVPAVEVVVNDGGTSASPSSSATSTEGSAGSEEDEDADSECVVCMSNPRTTLVFPCSHICVCNACFRRLDKCPVCRTDAVAFMSFSRHRLQGPLASASSL